MNGFPDDDIRWLLDTLAEENLAEITVEVGDNSVTVRSGASIPAPAPAPAEQCGEPPQRTESTAGGEALPDHMMPLLAPVSGTFFRASGPDSDPFVEVGDTIKAGDTVGLIEAMKLYHDINSPVGGRVAKILVENEDHVEGEQVLMLIDRSGA
jgi:acetyl-CoA carboxylase biotin carboxyl carrier protein